MKPKFWSQVGPRSEGWGEWREKQAGGMGTRNAENEARIPELLLTSFYKWCKQKTLTEGLRPATQLTLNNTHIFCLPTLPPPWGPAFPQRAFLAFKRKSDCCLYRVTVSAAFSWKIATNFFSWCIIYATKEKRRVCHYLHNSIDSGNSDRAAQHKMQEP